MPNYGRGYRDHAEQHHYSRNAAEPCRGSRAAGRQQQDACYHHDDTPDR